MMKCDVNAELEKRRQKGTTTASCRRARIKGVRSGKMKLKKKMTRSLGTPPEITYKHTPFSP